ncbi:hypothetical protein JA33_228 [Dickeya phage vB_DsoM_JA33]|uniref:Uncharacterized protein n=4 Tax=Salmondvirus TaxID=2733130 RepID=A0A384ZWL9_9CAUD|nr:hypothetical protein HOU08_gp229 [Dickeya phage vB_DsoM_JA29]YP_009813672.1 hypothetical protein HOU32_gp227 [Dickeya phage vB_DsoM_JA11]AXG66631.1 hypothetical protein JA13_228 [Dickeya phage vB_DsoM_JA13]AXG67602.1 hypothetical protein JA33_228 [Dickeya phage vB_DsoM_JA33]AXG66955.1 hypothetical protein JA29_229 [Dickeya phage vB_DsoM_JA29]AYD80032.1 hypothetical protein JA11_227 [Dickeya phage vB_DsoM_JA11]
MANRGEIRLAYNQRRDQWFSKEEEISSAKTVAFVDCRMFVQCTSDCVSEQSTDKKVISYYRENALVGQVVWVEEEVHFRLMI